MSLSEIDTQWILQNKQTMHVLDGLYTFNYYKDVKEMCFYQIMLHLQYFLG